MTAAASIVVGLPALAGSSAQHSAAQPPPAEAAAHATPLPNASSAPRLSTGPVAMVPSSVEGIIEAAQERPEPPVASRRAREPVGSPGARTTRLSPVTAIHSQTAVDRGALVTWTTSPTCLLAGHDTMGWAWLDDLATGTVVRVRSGPCAGTYQVVGHRWQPRKGGSLPSWMGHYDLVLQTCTGRSGTGFSTARRMAR
ncbi:hypothetical protein [Micromonospora sp. NPDC049274]|uniref:hypothetical protein n=1 Tax=Micromonospora sp. NPDC049274 TaxID=3154829 RepID=UPI00344145DB